MVIHYTLDKRYKLIDFSCMSADNSTVTAPMDGTKCVLGQVETTSCQVIMSKQGNGMQDAGWISSIIQQNWLYSHRYHFNDSQGLAENLFPTKYAGMFLALEK